MQTLTAASPIPAANDWQFNQSTIAKCRMEALITTSKEIAAAIAQCWHIPDRAYFIFQVAGREFPPSLIGSQYIVRVESRPQLIIFSIGVATRRIELNSILHVTTH